MRKLVHVALILAVCAVASSAMAAGDWKNQLRFGVSYFAPTSDEQGTIAYAADPAYPVADDRAKVKSTAGVILAYEYRANELIGIEVFTGYYKPKFELQTGDLQGAFETDTASARILPLGVSANFHVLRGSKIDVYLGPTLVYLFYGKPKMTPVPGETLEVKLKDELAYGAQVGVGVPVGPQWNVDFRLQYLVVKAKVDKITVIDETPVPSQVDLVLSNKFKPNPVVLSVMAGYTF